MAPKDNPARVEELFHAVADLPPEEAARLLDLECTRDDGLRQRVEGLVSRDRAVAPGFLLPNASLAAEVVAAADRTGGTERHSEEVLRSAETVGRFRVLERLGSGAMAVVYAAYDESLDRRVALKVLRRGIELPESLSREARALARLAHPNVVQIYEIGEHDAQPFIAMELVSGRSLDVWLTEKPRGVSEVLRTFLQAGRGLAAAHEAGLVHRDFKPDNVLVGTDGRVRVVDFGVSALREPGPAAQRANVDSDRATLPGTPAYMAPELFLGERATAASDQFAFCVALYRALFGCRPFAGDDVPTLRRNVLAGKLNPLPASADVPIWVTRILTRGLARATGDRFSSIDELLDAIERRLPHRSELDPTMGRRERRLLASAMGLLGLAVLMGIWIAGASTHARPTLQHFVLVPTGALAVHALAAVVLRHRILGNRFARKVALVVWIGVVTVVAHRLLAMHFDESVPEALSVDLLVLGMEHSIAAVLFESWFGLTASVFFAGALVAILSPAWAPTAMLGSVIAAYGLAAARVGL